MQMQPNAAGAPLSIGGHRLVPDKDLGIAYGEHLLRRLLSMLNVDMVFDVGANIGQYGYTLRKRIGYQGPLLSFEPIPQAATKLRALAEGDPCWQVRECAIDDRRGRAAFNVMVGDQFSSLLRPSPSFEGRFHGQHVIHRVIEVDVVTLGDAVRDAPAFSRALLKLDTQGNELRIVQGQADLLGLFPAIQTEVGFQMIYEGGNGYTDVVAALECLGYRLCALFPNNEGHFPHLLEMDALFLRTELLPGLS